MLGRFEVRAGDRLIVDRSWHRRKAAALLKLLALHKGRSLHREQVFDSLWRHLTPSAAANNLRKNRHYLRTAFAQLGITAPVVSVTGDMVILLPEVFIDVDGFRSQAQIARGDRNDPRLYEQALALYTGDLLPEEIYEDWTEPQREELRTLRIQLLTELSRLYGARGQPELAAEGLRQLLQADPLHEEAHRSLMRLYAQAGNHDRALHQYQSCRDILQRELGVEPSAETEALHREILARRMAVLDRAPTPAGAPGDTEHRGRGWG